jgi:hypothetical protein
MIAGCVPIGYDTSGLPEMVLSARPPSASQYDEAEPNDDYARANLVDTSESVALYGDLAAGLDTLDQDLFELGPAAAGDRVQADLTADVYSDIVLGLLDDQDRLIAYLDPSSFTTGPSRIDFIVRESTSRLYALVATRSGFPQARAYTVDISIERSVGLPAWQSQVIVLNFEGADGVRIGRRTAINIPPFDAANIDSRYAGQTETIIHLIMEMMAEDYAGLGVAIYRSDDADIPSGDRSTVYFGTYDERLLGLAENIDPYNTDLSQSAVLYTDTFSVFSVLSPDTQAMAQALANVASHEAGHLLGLRHTADVRDIMDITASARQMLVDQWFRSAALHATVLPMGLQDAPALLSWTLGGTLQVPSAAKLASLRKPADIAPQEADFYVPRWQLSTCFMDGGLEDLEQP